MRVCLFEDSGVAGLEPLTATRPAFELLCGQTTLGAKQARYFGASALGVWLRPYLTAVFHEQHPAVSVNDPAWLRAGPMALVNARWLPPSTGPADRWEPGVAMIGADIAYAILSPGQADLQGAPTLEDALTHWRDRLPTRPAGGALMHHLWDLIASNPSQLVADFQSVRNDTQAQLCPETVAIVGPRELVHVEPTARLDPLVVIDTTGGPVTIDRGAIVHSFTRIEGPCHVGPFCQLLGTKLRAGSTLGPHCRVGGEVEASIFHGYSNKYHDGFLGHSYIGAWVNLGAGTTNSDLRNDYGEVTVILGGQRVPTGQNKVGSFLGDHGKTAIGTLLNTGSNIGMFSNLVPAGPLLPKYVPPFTSWLNGRLHEVTDLSGVLATAARVMQRRGRTCTEAHAAMYTALFEATAGERRRALQDGELRRLRRSA
jgi:UDP-N-acetylglucosamine diphosphorylase/glucosamine-1-phosphate N-acetyltransferase